MSKLYGNCAFIFNEREIWSFNQFFNNNLDQNGSIFLEKSFFEELQSDSKLNQQIINKQQQIHLTELPDNSIVVFNKQKRNYAQEYLKLLDFSLYTEELQQQKLKELLIQNQYIDKFEMKIYQKYEKQFIIESGKIFGVPLVFYDIADTDHKHSLYLVDYLQQGNWKQLYRKVRLAQEVKKTFLLVIFDDQDEIQGIKQISNLK